MTKEELTICKMYLEDLDRTHDCNEYKLLMGLLEQQPSDDCVSRQALYEWLENWKEKNKYYHPHTKNEIIPICEVTDIIQSLPPVTPTRKQGEWCEQNDDYFNWYECSECGYGSEGEMQYSSECDVRTKYCPNCGAEMRGVENE